MSTTVTPPASTEQPGKGMRFTGAVANYVDERTSASVAVKSLGRKIFPDHWSFMLGEIALYSFIVILLSGTFLTFFYDPSMTPVIYEGSYLPLNGIEMSVAYHTALDISFEIRGGLLMRQVHHWAALLFVAAIGLHMLRVFFTGAFRKPREINWLVGFLLFILAMAEGFTGYSLPDDMLSGNGLRIIDGMIKSLPLIGAWGSYLFFGDEYPGTVVIQRLYILHIMLLPIILIAVLAIHMVLLIVNKHTQFAGPGRTNDNVVGSPVMPVFAAKAGGFFFLVFGVIMLIASTFTINPIWNYGPYDPSPVSAGTQPDWYIGFADGALRLIPPGWETYWFGYTWSWNVIVPTIVMLVFLAMVALYPFFEAWVTGDKREHHIAERPRNAPVRTGIGAAGVTFYGVMWAAASSDLMATHFRMSIEGVITFLQVLIIVGPFIAFYIAKHTCLALQRKDREIALHGYESGRIVRLPGGEYVEVHEQLDEYERWRLLDYQEYKPVTVRPNDQGKITTGIRLRAAMSRFFFEDRVSPVDRKELEEATKH